MLSRSQNASMSTIQINNFLQKIKMNKNKNKTAKKKNNQKTTVFRILRFQRQFSEIKLI